MGILQLPSHLCMVISLRHIYHEYLWWRVDNFTHCGWVQSAYVFAIRIIAKVIGEDFKRNALWVIPLFL